MPISNRSAFLRWSVSDGVTSRTAVYGPVRTVVWQGSAGDCRPYADQITKSLIDADYYLKVGIATGISRLARR
jgi:hypothetical protein